MTKREMLKSIIKDLVGVEKQYKLLKKSVENFCNSTDDTFKPKDLGKTAKDIVDGKYTYKEFSDTFDEEYRKARKAQIAKNTN